MIEQGRHGNTRCAFCGHAAAVKAYNQNGEVFLCCGACAMQAHNDGLLSITPPDRRSEAVGVPELREATEFYAAKNWERAEARLAQGES